MVAVDRIQGLSGSLAVKAPVRVATTANITLSGEQTIDAVAVVEGNRVLVKNQTDTTENGIYDVSTGAWTRSLDFDGVNDLVQGTAIVVQQGTVSGGTMWKVTTTAPVVGSAMAFDQLLPGDASTVEFTPAGTGAVATTVQAKLRESVSVKDFGAVGDGVADDAAAIQAAIDANPGDRIMFPNGKYLIGATLTITTPGTRLEGVTAGRGYFPTGDSGAVIICNAATTAVHFNNSASPTGTLHGCGMANIGIARTSHVASGSGLKLTDTSNFIGSNLAIDEFFVCLDLDGAQSCTFDNIRCYTGNSFTGAANSRLISVAGIAAGSTGADAGWINSFNQCILTSSLVSDYGFFISAGDSIKISNTYIGNCKLASGWIQASGDDVPLYSIAFNSVYFDGVSLNGLGTPNGVYVKDDGHIPASTPTVYDLKFSDCTFAQVNTALYIDDADIAAINVVGCEFHNVMETAVYISALTGINDGQFNFTGTTFRTIGYDNVGNNWAAIRMDGGADGLVVSGCVFDDIKDNTYVIHVSGTLKNLSATGCSFISDASHQFTDIYTTGATINQFSYSGNSSTSTLAPSMGYRPGNVANADPKALDWYEEGTFDPVLTFITPGNVSVAYTNQVARYTRIGNRVNVQIDILTSAFTHTTASGNLTITGMPAAITPRATGARWQGALEFQGITKATYTNFVMAAIASDAKLYISAGGSGVARSLVTAADMPSGGSVVINAQLTWEV